MEVETKTFLREIIPLKNLRKAMDETCTTIHGLSHKTGINVAVISFMLHGRYLVDQNEAQTISYALDRPMEELFS